MHIFNVPDSVELNMRFTTASGADRSLRIPDVERVDNLTVRFKGKDFIEAFRTFYTMALWILICDERTSATDALRCLDLQGRSRIVGTFVKIRGSDLRPA